jgi:hypothetical protein
VILATVKKALELVTVPALVPVTVSVKAKPAASVPTIVNVIAGEPAVTLPAVEAEAVMLVTVRNEPELVATEAFAPVTTSDKAAPAASVPTTVKVIPESSPAEVIVTFSAAVCVTDPPEAIAPVITKAVLPVTDAATEIQSASAESSPADVIMTFRATALVTEPLDASAPPITKAALFATAAATEIPSTSEVKGGVK